MVELPRVNERVSVRLPDWDVELRSRVEDATDGWVVVAMPTDGVAAYVLPAGRPVTISWGSRRGPASVQGRVAGRAPVRVPAFLVELTADPRVEQRREHVRMQALLDLSLAPADGPGLPRRAVTFDVSGGGALARVPGGIDADRYARLTLRLPEGPPIDLVARVVRRADDDVVGMRFELIAEPDRERVVRYVFTRLAAALRVRDRSVEEER
jgi:c-di-GMP-binding flagellar brake protein YcgR